MRRAPFLFSAAAFVSAPASADDATQFDSKSYARYAKPGPYEIQSSLAIALPGDQTRSKAGIVVSAYPDLPYTRAWLRNSAQTIAHRDHGTREFDDPQPPEDLAHIRHTATTDADGAFVIRNLAAGSWCLRGRLSIAFPRAVQVMQTIPAGTTAQGQPMVSEVVQDRTLVDYSFVWLDAMAIGVGKRFEPQVYFHVVARRNKIAHA